MSRADFYQLKSSDPASRYPLLCRLLEKSLGASQKVYILCQDEAEAINLDQYIWAFKPDSFIPHALSHEDAKAVVVLGWPEMTDSLAIAHHEICINLSQQLAPEHFQRIIELVVQDEVVLKAAREHYTKYSQLGHSMQYHKI
ncbi:DNA polymerase III subunit chi [Oceanospirillaceae bacterium]|nr:DNA polymerase III subunit chi [Oceanospirillaceae bacterium]